VNTRLELDVSYGALLRLPSVGRILLGMQIARIGQSRIPDRLCVRGRRCCTFNWNRPPCCRCHELRRCNFSNLAGPL